MSLDAIRDAARARIHEQFSLPAIIRNSDESVEIDTNVPVRFHVDVKKPFGDLDREGFALVIESYNQVIIDTETWTPIKHYVLDFGRGRKVQLENQMNSKYERYAKWEVTLK